MNAARHSRTASWAPTKHRVLAGAGAASLAMFMAAGVGIARAHSTVNLEVDGIVYPVSTWSHTVSGVLSQADIELGPACSLAIHCKRTDDRRAHGEALHSDH